MRSRPTSVTVAAVLLALSSLLNLVPLPVEGVPAVVVYGRVVLGSACELLLNHNSLTAGRAVAEKTSLAAAFSTWEDGE